MNITVRKAKVYDSNGVLNLLKQIAAYHQNGRPDLFKVASSKYSKEEFTEILQDEDKPVFVAVNEDNKVLGYTFCIVKRFKSHPVYKDRTSLYIDDLCVDESVRGQHIGKRLFENVKVYAKKIGCYNIDLNVWEFNENAEKFYENCGMTTQRRIMEFIL